MPKRRFVAIDRKNKRPLAQPAEVVVEGRKGFTPFELDFDGPGTGTAEFKDTSTHTLEQRVVEFEIGDDTDTGGDVLGIYHPKMKVKPVPPQKLGLPFNVSGTAYGGTGFDGPIFVIVEASWMEQPTRAQINPSAGSWLAGLSAPKTAGYHPIVIKYLGETVNVTVSVRH